MNKVRFWIFEAISIICFIGFCFFTFAFSIAADISKLLVLSSFITLILASYFKKTASIKKIAYVFLHLLIYVIIFFIYTILILEISDWSLGNISLILYNLIRIKL